MSMHTQKLYARYGRGVTPSNEYSVEMLRIHEINALVSADCGLQSVLLPRYADSGPAAVRMPVADVVQPHEAGERVIERMPAAKMGQLYERYIVPQGIACDRLEPVDVRPRRHVIKERRCRAQNSLMSSAAIGSTTASVGQQQH